MGVYIEGMEMPKNCAECALNYDCFKCIVTGTPFFDHEHHFDDEATRLDNCPLVPVPPHGRLIDAEWLKQLYDDPAYGEDVSRYHVAIPVILANIDDAPTIIEAEEGE